MTQHTVAECLSICVEIQLFRPIVFLQEEEKILFFHPRETNIDVQMREVGLSEAIVKFTEYVHFEIF